MYMGRVSVSAARDVAGELSAARVLITGLTASDGVDVARTFAELKTRLVVHTQDLSPDLIELVALLSQSAAEIKLHTHDITSADAAAAFAQSSAQAYGGLEATINFATISPREIENIQGDSDLVALVSGKLAPLAQLTRVIANRMSVVLSEGLILNVLKMPHPETARQSAVAAYVRTALASMTVNEARAWGGYGIRINAVAPGVVPFGGSADASAAGEPEFADVALHLMSREGRAFSGHVFDADATIY